MTPESLTDLIPWLFGGGMIFLTIFIIICSLVPFVAIFGGLGWYIYRRSKESTAMRQASQSWSQTQGVVILSRVEVSGGEITSVTPRVVYQYDVNGQRYQSEQIRAGDRFMQMTSSRSAYDTIDRYPVGTQVTVFYNPQNPTEAALER